MVLAIPRGGVVVAYQIAYALKLMLDVIITKKIGAPDNPELAIGAVAEDGTTVFDDKLVIQLNVSQDYINAAVSRQKMEIRNRLRLYRGDVPYPHVVNREVILVDDGVATGSTMIATLKLLQNKNSKSITVAIPVGPPGTVSNLENLADRVVCLCLPKPFYAIGQFYENFNQISHAEVKQLLQRNRKETQLSEEAK